jgi:diguanylate cyclase (GGDEF)-like protein
MQGGGIFVAGEIPMIVAFKNLGLNWALVVIWTFLAALSGFLYIQHSTRIVEQVAALEVEALYQKLYAYRHWNARIGGIYVPVTEETPPNPYLQGLPERDIVTPSGKRLTLMNPAYMLRHILRTGSDDSSQRGSLTSLKPINPGNAPDAWEKQALLDFERGAGEVLTIRNLNGEDYLSLMRPLKVEASCLKCHASQGYQVGDVRGGLSASVALAPLRAAGNSRLFLVLGGHLLIWGAGCRTIQRFNDYFKNHFSRSQKLKAALNRASNFDKLTGLPNQLQFIDRLRWAISQAERRKELLAVLCLDLDHFKKINSAFGHGGGNRILIEVAGRLAGCLRQTDIVARLGGDSFTILMLNPGKVEDSAGLACKIQTAVNQPFFIENHEVHITASIGIACYPMDGGDPENILKHADTALQRAKNTGRDSYQIYSPEMNLQAIERLRLENDLRKGLQREEFVLYYQPQVDAATGQVTGAEALLRWQHPQRGLVGPQEFIAMAEETGLIVPLGEWVIRSTCQQIRHWIDEGLQPVRIAVNLSARQFQQGDLAGTIGQILAETEIPAEYLGLEITESAIMHDTEKAIAVLSVLRQQGIHISIDDFGTGYSSLSQLKILPIDVLKIDRSFVKDIPDNADSISIINAIIAMARSLNLKVLAEGAETESQYHLLQQLQCNEVQGYLFSRPITAAAFRRQFIA